MYVVRYNFILGMYVLDELILHIFILLLTSTLVHELKYIIFGKFLEKRNLDLTNISITV